MNDSPLSPTLAVLSGPSGSSVHCQELITDFSKEGKERLIRATYGGKAMKCAARSLEVWILMQIFAYRYWIPPTQLLVRFLFFIKTKASAPHTHGCGDRFSQCLSAEYWRTHRQRQEPPGDSSLPLLPLAQRLRHIDTATQTIASRRQKEKYRERNFGFGDVRFRGDHITAHKCNVRLTNGVQALGFRGWGRLGPPSWHPAWQFCLQFSSGRKTLKWRTHIKNTIIISYSDHLINLKMVPNGWSS